MQILPGIIQILNGTGSWAGRNGEHGETPRITVALAARLLIDLRGADRATPETADLAPYPFTEFADCVSWYIAIDSDYNQLTMPPIKRSTGISITQDDDGKTILAADLPILDSPEIRATVKTAGEIPLKGEIGALDAEGNSVFCVDFPIILKNRVYIPGGGGDTPDPQDPEYLNTDQVKAFVLSELSAAMTALDIPEGEPGPAPTLSIGTVTVGETAAATITPGGAGAYAINLVLPRATDGTTPEPITPQITVGTIQAGTEAAASLVPVAGTPGAFTLNLTLPRGADGSGVTPSGQWAADANYNLNAAVRHASAWWRSLHDDNTGNEPPANRVDNAHWEVIVKDGISADPLIVNYNDTDDPDDTGWHLYRIATDRYYRFTTDGGLTFTEAMELSQAPLNVLILFNPDATTDWHDVPAPIGTNNYHIATGKYYRVKTDAGIWGTPQQIHALGASEVFRVQYGATPANENDEPSWHAIFQAGDDRILFYNTTGSIRLDVKVSLEDGEEIGGVQLCSISNPWHATYAVTDKYRKISVDSGVTWTMPIPLRGKDAYDDWLDLGNTGSRQDFLNSLKGEPGEGAVSLSDSTPAALGSASAGTADAAARGDHVHPTTGLVLSSEKGAANGVASLGADGKVPEAQLPEMSGGGSGTDEDAVLMMILAFS